MLDSYKMEVQKMQIWMWWRAEKAFGEDDSCLPFSLTALKSYDDFTLGLTMT